MKKLKVGIIGLGVGEAHLEGCQRNNHCEVIQVCDFSEEKFQQLSCDKEYISFTQDANDVLENKNIDVVSIASFDDHHATQVIKALNHNKHVFVEKPLCLSLDELKSIRKAFESNKKLRLTSNLILRKSPRFEELKKMVQDGKLGKLYCLEGDYNYGRLEKITQGWRGRIKDYSIILGGAIHLVDLLCWFAEERVVEVTAYGNNLCTQETDLNINDCVVGLMQFRNGMVAKVSANFGCVFPHFHRLAIYGTEGTFVNDLSGASLIQSRETNREPLSIDSTYPGVEKNALIDNFIEAILGNSELLVKEDHVFDMMSVCLAFEKSLEQKAPIKVEYI